MKPPPVPWSTKPKQQVDAVTHERSVFEAQPRRLGASLPSIKHTLQPLSLRSAEVTRKAIHTNKFYANLFLGSRNCQIYPLPYTIKWSGYGLDINHTEASQRVFGQGENARISQYFFCPVGIVSLQLTAAERPTILELEHPRHFSINVSLRAPQGSLCSSIVRGSAFISVEYANLTPEICSQVMFRNIKTISYEPGQKWRLLLEDGRTWLLYAFGSQKLTLQQRSNTSFIASGPWTGLLQIIKLPACSTSFEATIDSSAGTFCTSIELRGTVESHAQYSFHFTSNRPRPVLMYALPHHVKSFMPQTSIQALPAMLASQTNGDMTLILADAWYMQEYLPSARNLSMAPSISDANIKDIQDALSYDLDSLLHEEINLDSMYFSGKVLNRLAQATILARNSGSEHYSALLARLEHYLLLFVRNQQQFGLAYDETWGGILSTQGFSARGDGADFGNTWYNDHHYHYGYFISSSAIYLNLQPSSAHRALIIDWTTNLIEDIASCGEEQFPFYRAMDWFVGHSWSKGLYESSDGKDEESSSEDYHASYAIYLFGRAINDENLSARAMIQLALQRSSIGEYMLFKPTNTTMPPEIIPNCVSGIKFENKVDYTTYFGNNLEYIHGIHILPITPITRFMRSADFVLNEWKKLSSLTSIDPAWRGILISNIALYATPRAIGEAVGVINSLSRLDSGASRAWYLACIHETHNVP